MFFVGTYSTFSGADSVENTKVKDLEKLGHSAGRANRYLNSHRPSVYNGVQYRAVVFVLPERFRLANDLIRATIKHYKCDWDTAKFHCYRLAAVDITGNKEDWSDKFKEQDTAAPEAQAISGTALESNVPVETGAASLS